MNKFLILIIGLCLCGSAFGQSTAPAVSDTDPTAAITQLRQGLIDAFNRKDIDGVLRYLSPDVVVTWQDGRVCVGPDQVKAYYLEKMAGTHPIVATITSNPQVDGRHVYDGWAVSYGHMNDHFTLTNGMELDMNSHFTATIARHGDRWLVNAFHLSVDAFDNPVLAHAEKQSGTYGLIAGGASGFVLGAICATILGRRKRKLSA